MIDSHDQLQMPLVHMFQSNNNVINSNSKNIMTVRASCMYKNKMPVGKPLLISLGYYQDMHDPFNLYASFSL